MSKNCNHSSCKYNEYGFCTADGCTLNFDSGYGSTDSRNVGTPFNSGPLKITIPPEVKDQLVEIAKNIILEAVEDMPEKAIPISYIEDRIKELNKLAKEYDNYRYRADALALETLLVCFKRDTDDKGAIL